MQAIFHFSYLLCATCRSGSACFCKAPKKTEVAGHARKCFLSYSVPCCTETLEVTDDADYLRVTTESAATHTARSEPRSFGRTLIALI